MNLFGIGTCRFGASLLLTIAGTPVSTPAYPQTPQAAGGTPYRWVTLGTMGGPLPSLERHEPANALVGPDGTILVDSGDGAATQLAGAGIRLDTVRAIVLSHHHFDHVGGLFALLGLRNQQGIRTPLTIYGPPLTKELVSGLLAGMKPAAETGFGVEGEKTVAPGANMTVIELANDASVTIGKVKVTAVENTHYALEAKVTSTPFRSLSYRFDLPDRSIVYTGDTGPSAAVEKLAAGADLLVSEVIDLDAATSMLKRVASNMPAPAMERMISHIRDHHLTTRQVGELAARARVRKVVLTHVGGGSGRDTGAPSRYEAEVTRLTRRPTVVAADLQSF